MINSPPTPNQQDNDVPFERFQGIRVATLNETRSVHHRLILRPDRSFDIHLYHHPMEIYMAWGLHKTPHVYQNLGPLQQWPPPLDDLSSAKLIFSDMRPIESCPNIVMVARPGSVVYDEAFSPNTFQLPIQKLMEFVVRNGQADATRSTGWRLDLSNAGRSYEPNGSNEARFRPKVLCGDQIFRDDPDGPLVRVVLGRLVDGICRAGKVMARKMDKPHALNAKRYEEYAFHLQQFLFANNAYTESITLQLLNLSNGDCGTEHMDVLNDHRSTYDSTMAKVMNFVDSNSHLYSFKILCNFRKTLGDFYSVQMSKIERLLVAARTMLAEVDASYSRLVSHHKGAHQPMTMPTWLNIDDLYFDDKSPWCTTQVTSSVQQDSIQVLTGIARGIWLSPALSSIYQLSPQLSERGMVQLLMIASWQNSFQRFWEASKRMADYNFEYPIFEYYRVARELFYKVGNDKGQEMFGGESPRFGPIGFDFKEVFGTNEDPKTVVVDKVVDAILNFFDQINLLEEDAPRGTVMQIVATASASIGGIAKCELGCFRLMILLQCAIYLRVRLTPAKRLRQIFFQSKVAVPGII